MAKETNVSYNGIGFAGLLAIAFIVLKLCDVITWSWIWVLSPLWIGVAIVIAILIFILIFASISYFKYEMFGKN